MERFLIPLPEKGYQVPSKRGLRDEILTIVSAGEDTTGIANTVTIFNIVNIPHIHARFLAELKTVMSRPDSQPPYLELEQLPYLAHHSHAHGRIIRGRSNSRLILRIVM